ncbi:MAG: FAD-dependent oxidoreductase [Pseudomonadota bacterium]|nr:FAD-dependent oxidoreductase [Pseudomonadota bacterium]
MHEIVIVGAGEAGGRAAIALREGGYAGRLTLIGEEAQAPYERPPLSKAALVDPDEPRPTTISGGERLAELDVARIAAVVAALEPADRRVALADGRRLGYDALILATGARARALRLPGGEHALTLRSFDDAQRLRARLRAATRVVVIGGGFIGLELAAAARALGREVTVLEADTRLLRRSTPEPLASALEARHARAGVEIAKGVRIERIEPRGRGFVVHSSLGEREADLVVAGIGAEPRTELAAAAGLAVDNGIVVDGQLRTRDPQILAVGDCANFPHPLYPGRRLRLEAWRHAFDSGAHAAAALLGADDAYAAPPWFWSDQYDLTLQMVGLTEAGATTVQRDLADGATMLFHLDGDGRLVAAGGLGTIERIGKEIKLAERLIGRRATPSPAALADPGANLKKLI